MKINEPQNDFIVIEKYPSVNGIIYDATVKVLKEAFNATDEQIVEAYATQRWAAVRSQRDKLLTECDWVVTKNTEAGQPIPEAWSTYRQALRDITNQADPDEITWPQKP